MWRNSAAACLSHRSKAQCRCGWCDPSPSWNCNRCTPVSLTVPGWHLRRAKRILFKMFFKFEGECHPSFMNCVLFLCVGGLSNILTGKQSETWMEPLYFWIYNAQWLRDEKLISLLSLTVCCFASITGGRTFIYRYSDVRKHFVIIKSTCAVLFSPEFLSALSQYTNKKMKGLLR